ncbi:hypothetical protein [Natrinema pallidum]|uniref:hypothetical protein n=1 Tax=Natrinema pallidum TaxID=69527 RepID=UPI003753193A
MSSRGKPDNLSGERFAEQIKKLTALKKALDDTECVVEYETELTDRGRLTGRVGLRHEDSFIKFNDLLTEHPVAVAALYSEDKIVEAGADSESDNLGFEKEVEIRVILTEV